MSVPPSGSQPDTAHLPPYCASRFRAVRRPTREVKVGVIHLLFFIVGGVAGCGTLPSQNSLSDNQEPQIFEGNISKLFGGNTAFTGTLHYLIGTADGAETTIGKVAYAEGKSSYQIDLSETVLSDSHGNSTASLEDKAKLKASGMAIMTTISRPDKERVYAVLPTLNTYLVQPHNYQLARPDSDLTTSIVELGKEKVEGYDCVKNKITFTPKSGTPEIFTVWNAGALNNFPIQIQYIFKDTHFISLTFTDIKLEKPDDSVFEPPVDAKKFADAQTLMWDVVTPRLDAMQDASSGAPLAPTGAPEK